MNIFSFAVVFFLFSVAQGAFLRGVEGRVEKLREGRLEWSKAELGSPLRHNDRLRTTAKSRARLLFADSTSLELKEKSSFLLNLSTDYDHRVFANMNGRFAFDFSTLKEETRIFVYAGGFRMVLGRGRFGLESTDSSGLLQVFEGKAWTGGTPGGEALVSGGGELHFSATGYRIAELLLREEKKQSGFVNENAGHPSTVIVRLRTFEDSSGSPRRWRLAGALKNFLDVELRLRGVRVLEKTWKADSSFNGGQIDLVGRITRFDMKQFASFWQLKTAVDFEVRELSTGFLLRDFRFEKEYSGNMAKGQEVLRYLPFDTENNKIRESFMKNFLFDLREAVIRGVEDPF